jgi:hypothetical protein
MRKTKRFTAMLRRAKIMRLRTSLAFCLTVTLCTVGARAEEPAPSEPSPYYWDRGQVRPFVSVAPALGAVSTVDVVLGYGKPHWMWGGLEGTGLLTPEFAAVAGGPRLAFIIADLSLKRRQSFAYSRGFLLRQQRYSADDVNDAGGAAAEYGAWDASLSGVIPTPVGFGLWELAATFVDGIPAGRDVFEEYQRVVMRGNSAVWMVRGGFAFWLVKDTAALGALGEWLSAEDRGQTWRLGPFLDWTFTDHLGLTLVVTAPVSAPDDLGLVVGSWGTLRLRYAWASGEPQPAFP